MSIIDTIVKEENPRDVILFVTRGENGISYPILDRLYNTNNWVNISNNLELMKLVDNMVSEGLIVSKNLTLTKGPNWKNPTFITENKYMFE
ncbi:hypothetical protein SAMN03159316_2386 [Pseudomonas sp. NFR02]|uniref:hypothetical protein n=1 Tax=Pseudomonas sp. NFR02 TaxID=1566229 RepID=UPI00091A2EEB|nr:hypothetical protein [Pseudomonas sp. NFR02]SFX64767.1 hypothetical protein SAMN03159316_2386 [Pseudomonas sp. NFR02]